MTQPFTIYSIVLYLYTSQIKTIVRKIIPIGSAKPSLSQKNEALKTVEFHSLANVTICF